LNTSIININCGNSASYTSLQDRLCSFVPYLKKINKNVNKNSRNW
jgi:hypothetical protein